MTARLLATRWATDVSVGRNQRWKQEQHCEDVLHQNRTWDRTAHHAKCTSLPQQRVPPPRDPLPFPLRLAFVAFECHLSFGMSRDGALEETTSKLHVSHFLVRLYDRDEGSGTSSTGTLLRACQQLLPLPRLRHSTLIRPHAAIPQTRDHLRSSRPRAVCAGLRSASIFLEPSGYRSRSCFETCLRVACQGRRLHWSSSRCLRPPAVLFSIPKILQEQVHWSCAVVSPVLRCLSGLDPCVFEEVIIQSRYDPQSAFSQECLKCPQNLQGISWWTDLDGMISSLSDS